MGNRAKLSTKMLSLFLSVLMAVSCFGIVFPSLAPEAFAEEATDEQWQTLKDALTTAKNGGFLGTDVYTVNVDENGNATVYDNSQNGFIYAVVRAVGEIAVKEGAAEGRAHNALLAQYICNKLQAESETDDNFSFTQYQRDFITAILPVGPGSTYESYNGSSRDATWNGTEAAMNELTDHFEFTTTVTRGIKGAVITDYTDIMEMPNELDVKYKVIFAADLTEIEDDNDPRVVPGTAKHAYYANTSVQKEVENAPTPDLSALVAYNAFVRGVQLAPNANPLSDADKYAPGFAAGYAAYGENHDSLYYENANDLIARYDVYMALQAAANECDGDYVRHFVGIEAMQSWSSYASAANAAARAVLAKNYVDWLNGVPLNDGSINRDDYDENDRGRIEALILQASSFLHTVNALASDVQEVMTDIYGYKQNYQLTKDLFPITGKEYFALQQTAVDNGDDTQSVQSEYVPATATEDNIASLYERVTYENYIQDMRNKLERCELKVIRDAAETLMRNDESYTYSFPVGSAYSSFYLTPDTEPEEGKTYYKQVKGSWQPVSAEELAAAEDFGSFYEASVLEMTGVGNDCFVSKPYQEAGALCPVDYLTLCEDVAWFEGAVVSLNAASAENRRVVMTEAQENAIREMCEALQTELEYRDFDDQPGEDAQTFRTEYAWFVDAIANKNPSFMSTAVLLGYSYVQENPETHEDETITVAPFLDTAKNHFNALQNALNRLAGSAEVKAKYQDFVNQCSRWVNGIYSVLYHRAYDPIDQLFKDAGSQYNGSAIDSSNFAIVKADIANLDEVFDDEDEPWPGEETQDNPLPAADKRTRGIQNVLYNWLSNNQSIVTEKVPEATLTTYSHMQNVVSTDTIKAYLNACKEVMAGGWASWNRYYNDYVTYTGGKNGTAGTVGTSENGGTGIYTVRQGRADDMVRKDDNKDYVVSNDKIDSTTAGKLGVIQKLDAFAGSQQFIKLINQYDPANGVTNLRDFLQKILVENLFNDDMVNTIIALLFPMVVNTIYNLLSEKLGGLEIEGKVLTAEHPQGNALVSIKLKALVEMLNVNNLYADDKYANIYADGERGTITFANAFAQLGLNIFPQQFASVLPNSVNGKSLSTFKSNLSSQDSNRWEKMDADHDGEIKKEDLAAKGAVWGVHDFETFCNAIGAVFNSILPLLKAVFTNYGFTSNTIQQFVYLEIDSGTDVHYTSALSAGVGGSHAYGDVQISLSGVQGYNNVWGPIFEALGVGGNASAVASGYGVNDFTVATPFSSSFGTSGNSANYQQFARALFMPVWALVNQLLDAPIATVLDILPTVAYDLAYNMVTPLLNTLETNIHLNVQIRELNISGGVIAWLVNLFKGPIQNKLNDDVLPSLIPDIPLNVGSMLDFRDLLGMDITNLNDIVKYIIGKIREGEVTEENAVNLPAINTARIGGLGDKSMGYSIRTNDQSGAGTGHRFYVVADKADVLYELLHVVLSFVSTSGNLSGLITSFSGSGLGSAGEILEPILGAIDTEEALAALVELFYPQTYDMTPYDWYQPNSDDSTYHFGDAFNQANFAYLKYENDWTRAKAQYLFDNLENAVDDVVSMIDGDMLDGYAGFSDWLLKFINQMFNNNGINNMLDLMMKLAGKLDNENKMVANLIKDQITVGETGDVDIFSWYRSFGYLYPEFRVLKTIEVEKTRINESTQEEETYTENVQEVVYLNKNGDYCVGYPETYEQMIDGVTYTLTEMHFLRTYPLAPAGFKGFTENEDGSYSLTTAAGGAGATDAAEVSYVYGFRQSQRNFKKFDNFRAPSNADERQADANYLAKKGPYFSNLDLTILDEPDENDNMIVWGVTGNPNTAQFGVTSGDHFDLIDGAMGTEEGATQHVTARAVFTAIFSSLMEPIAPVLYFLLNGQDLGFFDNTLKIQGYDVYNGAIVPVLEMLGVTDLKTSEQYNAPVADGGFREDAMGGFYYLTNKTFSALTKLLTKDDDGTPLQKVIELLPRVFYFLQSDGLSSFLRNMLMPIWVLVDDIRPIADVNLDVIIHNLLAQLLGVELTDAEHPGEGSADQNAISNLVNRFLNLSPILTTEVSDTTKIVQAIKNITLQKLKLKDIANVAAEFTGMNLYPLFYAFEGMCNGYTLGEEENVRYGVMTYTSSHYDIAVYNRTHGGKDYSRTYTMKYAGPDTVTVTVCAVLDLLRFGDNARALDNLIGLTRELLPGETQESTLTAAGLLEGLEVVFEKRGSLTYQHPNWDYLLEGKAVKGPDDNTILWSESVEYQGKKGWEILLVYSDLSSLNLHNKHDEVTKRALAYKSDWTRETAVGMDVLFSTVLDYVTQAFLAKDNENITSFADFANDLINTKLLGASTLRTLAGFIAMLYNFVPASVVGVVDTLLKTDLSQWREAGYIRLGVNGQFVLDENGQKVPLKNGDGKLVDEDGNILPEGAEPVYEKEDNKKYYVNEAYPWWATEEQVVLDENNETVYAEDGVTPLVEFVPAGEEYVDTRDEFFDAITQLLTPVSALLGFIMLEDSYKLFYSVGATISTDDSTHEGTHDVTPDDDVDAIILDGAGAWGKGFIPLLEALGIEKILNDKNETLRDYAPSVYSTEEEGVYEDEQFLSDFLYLIRTFAEGVIADPVNWLLDNLANVIYFINAEGVTTAIKNILDSVQKVLDAINTQLDADSRISTSNLAGLNLSHLSLEGILKLVERFTGWKDDDGVYHTGLHINDELIEYIRGLYIGQLSHYNSANGYVGRTVTEDEILGVDAFRMDPLPLDGTDPDQAREDRAALITVFVSLVIEIAEDSGQFVDPDNNYDYSDYDNPAVIDHLAGTNGMVQQIIHAIRNPLDLMYTEINWTYFDEHVNLSNTDAEGRVLDVPGYMFQYLNYTTQWTYTKAAATKDGLENMIVSILKLVDKDKYGEMTGLGELLSIEKFYSGEYLQKLLDLLAKVLYGENAVVPEQLLNVAGALLGADLSQWNRTYAFGTDDDFSDAVLQAPDETGLQWAMLPLMAQQTDIDGNPVFESDGTTPVMVNTGRTIKTYLVNDRESFVAGATLMLAPAYRLLDWLLFGADYGFFTGNTASSENDILLKVPGSDGYSKGLVLLLEALGCTELKFASAYKDAEGNVDTAAYMSDILNSICNRVEEILADPINEVANLIPELIYFINAGGLQTVVLNLLAGPISLINSIDALRSIGGDGSEETVTDADRSVVDSLISNILNNALKDIMGDREIDFDMNNINLQFICEIAEAITGLEITDVVRNKLDLFRMGDIVRYQSMSGENGRTAYRMQFSSTEDFADFITILLSFVLDTLLYKTDTVDNAAALGALIGNDNEQTSAIIATVVSFLREGFTVGEAKNIDWLYFDPAYSLYDENGVVKEPAPDYNETTTVVLPERTINYLTYYSDWTDELAHYIYDNRTNLINTVLTMANLADTEVLGLKLGEIFNDGAAADLVNKVFTGDNLNTILDAIKGLTSKPNMDAIFDLLHIILDIDLSVYNTMEPFPAGEISEDAFIDGLVQILSPLETVLDWLLFGENKSLKYFDKQNFDEYDHKLDVDGNPLDSEGYILEQYTETEIDEATGEEVEVVKFRRKLVDGQPVLGQALDIQVLLEIKGANGYDYGLIPILEALGINGLPVSNAGSTTSTMLPAILRSLVARVKEILRDPVDQLLDLIPNLLYFINSKGLIASVFNLLSGPMGMLEKVNEALDPDGTHPEKRVGINTLLSSLNLGLPENFDILSLDLLAIFNLLEGLLGVQITGENGFVDEAKIKNFYFGSITLERSANGKVRGTMKCDENEDQADLLTILVNFVIELALHEWEEDGVVHSNAEAIEKLLNLEPGTITGIIEAIKTLGTEAAPGDYHWAYFNEVNEDGTPGDAPVPEGGYTAPFYTRTANNQFENYLTYADGQLWKQETANNLYDNLGAIIDNIISMTASDENAAHSLHDLIAGSFNLYTAENLNTILGYIDLAYEKLGSFVTLIGLVLGADLTSWKDLTFSDSDVIDRDTFRIGLIEILKPLYPVLDWLLFGRAYAFFVPAADGNILRDNDGEPILDDNGNYIRVSNELLKIAGSQGYAYALAPLLETLGVQGLPECRVGETTCGTLVNGRTFFDLVVEALLNRVDQILANPVHEAFVLLPQLLYFINANGLATVVQNLLGSIINAGNMLVEKGVLQLEGGTTVADYIENMAGINIANLDLEGIFAFVETLDALHGLKLNEVFTKDFDEDGVAENILEYFYAGAGAQRKEINVINKDGTRYAIYTLKIAEGKQGDVLTLLFSIVLEILFYDGNEDALTALINSFIDQDPDDGEDAFTKEAFVAIKALLADGADPSEMQTMDWVYFNEYPDDAARQEAIMAVLTARFNELPPLPERTVNYLKYAMNNNSQMHNLWSEDVVSYVDANLNDIVNKVIGLITNGEVDNLKDFIRSKLDLFTQETADMIVGALVGALDSIDEALLNTAGSLLGIPELASLKTARAENVTDKESFVNELSRILKPAEPLLKWLLFGGDFRFFTKLDTGEPAILSIKGGKGYKYGLAPILDALGIATAVDADNILHDLLMNVANRVEEILENPIDEILNLLPELIYFINANGLGTAVTNLLNPIDSLLKTAGKYIGKPELSINSLITAIDLEHLDFTTIFGILKDATGIVLSDEAGEPIGRYLDTFYFGKLDYVTIYDDPDPTQADLKGFHMVYTATDARYDMITILVALVLDAVVYNGNHDAIVNLLKNIDENKAEDIYNAIMAFLLHHEVQVEMVPYRWILTDYAVGSADPTKAGKVLMPVDGWDGSSSSIFGNQIYGPLYTRPMGEYITRFFPLFVNTWITLLGIEDGHGGTYRNLDDLLSGLIGVSVYKTSLLETISDAVGGAVDNLKDMIGEELFVYITDVLKKSVGVDITTLTEFEPTPFADGDREAFVDQLCQMASLVAPILRWLLTGQSLALFTDRDGKDYIVIEGARAYKDAIIPILEALHAPASSIKTQEEYEALTANNDAAMLKLILNPLLDRVDQILADPLNQVFDILPGVAYFINSKGLDSAFKNILNAVYKVLVTIEPLIADVDKLHKNGEVSLYPLLGEDFDLEVFDFTAIADLLVGLINNAVDGMGLELTGVLDNAVYELTVGVVSSFQSKRGETDYTMHYAGGASGSSGGGYGDKTDLATVVMRLVLNFLASPHNVQALEQMLNGTLNGNGYKFVCALLENFQQLLTTENGIDKVMYTVYYIFYVALNTGVATNNGLAEFNYNYSFMNRVFSESNVGFLRQMATSFGWLLDKNTPDVVTHDEAVPNGFIRFFRSIIDFFKRIAAFFKNLFSR